MLDRSSIANFGLLLTLKEQYFHIQVEILFLFHFPRKSGELPYLLIYPFDTSGHIHKYIYTPTHKHSTYTPIQIRLHQYAYTGIPRVVRVKSFTIISRLSKNKWKNYRIKFKSFWLVWFLCLMAYQPSWVI